MKNNIFLLIEGNTSLMTLTKPVGGLTVVVVGVETGQCSSSLLSPCPQSVSLSQTHDL